MVAKTLNEEPTAAAKSSLVEICKRGQECSNAAAEQEHDLDLAESSTSGGRGREPVSHLRTQSRSQQDRPQAKAQPRVGTGWPPYRLMTRTAWSSAASHYPAEEDMKRHPPFEATDETGRVGLEDQGQDMVLVLSTTSSSAPSESGVEDNNSVSTNNNNASLEDIQPATRVVEILVPVKARQKTTSPSHQDGLVIQDPLVAIKRGGLEVPEEQQEKEETAEVKVDETAQVVTNQDKEDKRLCRFIKNRNRRTAKKRRRIAFLEAVSTTASEVASAVLTAAVSAAPGNQEVIQAVVEASKVAIAKAEEAAKMMPVSYKDHTPARRSAFATVNRASTVNPWLSATEVKTKQGLSGHNGGLGLNWPPRGDDQELNSSSTADQLREGLTGRQGALGDLGLGNLSSCTLSPGSKHNYQARRSHQDWPFRVEDRRGTFSTTSQESYGQEKTREVLKPIPWTPSKWQPWN